VQWTRAALEARVDKLSQQYDGDELVSAVSAFAEQLDEDDRQLLGRILLERAPRRAGVTANYPRWRAILPSLKKPPPPR
jgi:hypothetical protein